MSKETTINSAQRVLRIWKALRGHTTRDCRTRNLRP